MSYAREDGTLREPQEHYVGDACPGGHHAPGGGVEPEQRCICGHTSADHPDDGEWYACAPPDCLCTGWFGEPWPLSAADRAELRDLDYGGVFAWFLAHDRHAKARGGE